jgi:hypothetical protein
MFLFAFLVIEVAALIARKSVDLSVQKDLPGIHHARTAAWASIAEGFEAIERRLFTIGAVAHCTVLPWAFLDLWNLRNSFYLKPGIEEPDSIWITTVPLSVMALCLAMLFYITHGTFKMFRDAIHRRFPGRNGLLGVYTLILIGAEISFLLLWLMTFYIELFRDSVLFYLGFACLFLLEWAIRRLCLLWFWLRYNPEGTVNPSWTAVFG